MTDQDSFSFRWGIPLLDNGQTLIPNFMLDHWHETPVTRTEFLVIIHLARYRYERPGSESRPSVGTIAKQLGYESNRGLQMMLASLEEKGMLTRHFQTGKPTIYDFSGFSEAVLNAATAEEARAKSQNKRSRGEETFTPCQQGDEETFTPRDEETFTPGVNVSSPKEEEIRRKEIRRGNDDQEIHSSSKPQVPKRFDLEALWRSCLTELKMQMTQSTFVRWLAQARLVSLDPDAGEAIIEAPDLYAVEWLADRLNPPIQRTLAGISGVDNLQIEYVLAGEREIVPRPNPPGKRITITLPGGPDPPPRQPPQRESQGPPALAVVQGRAMVADDAGESGMTL